MESLRLHESPDVTPNPDTRWLESVNSTASSIQEELPSDIESFTITPLNDDTIPAPGHRLQVEEVPANHVSVTPEEMPLSYETLVPDDTRVVERAERCSNISRLQRLPWWWFWELGGITISVCCMIALLVLLPYLDNSPLNNWRFLVAPNTMISTFITVAKTSMLLAVAEAISQLKWHNFKKSKRSLRDLDLFDAASRGPWGAFIFIIHMIGKRESLFAILGAFVVVASLTMEPFAQQILSFENRRINSTQDVASFSILHVWNNTNDGTTGQQSIESGFMKGLVTSPAPFQFSCSSGNCTWPDFSALGICASCSNVTRATTINHEVKSYFNNGSDDRSSQYEATALHGDPDDCLDILYNTPAGVEVRMSRGCSFRRLKIRDDKPDMAGTPLIRNLPDDDNVQRYSTYETYQALPTSMASNAKYSGFSKNVSDSTIAVFAISKANIDGKGLSGRISGLANMTECQLTWCEKIFQNVDVSNGRIGPMDITNRNLSNSELKQNIGYWKSWVEGGRINSSDIPDAWRFVADQMTFAVAVDSHLKFGPISVISEAENPLKVFENIAEAMTRQLYISNSSLQQPGHAYVQEVFVVVRWQWAVFPMILVLLGLVFLVGNLWVNSREGVFLWKSSLLPLLFHGLDGFDPEILDVDKSSEMTEAAKEMYARLEKNDAGSTKLVCT